MDFLFKKKLDISSEHIFLDEAYVHKSDILDFFVQKALALGIIDDASLVKNAFLEREAQGETGVGNGIAIPHARSKHIKKPSILFYRGNTRCDDWGTLDDAPVEVIFAILIPEKASKEHLKMLSRLSMALLDDALLGTFKGSRDAVVIASEISRVLSKD